VADIPFIAFGTLRLLLCGLHLLAYFGTVDCRNMLKLSQRVSFVDPSQMGSGLWQMANKGSQQHILQNVYCMRESQWMWLFFV